MRDEFEAGRSVDDVAAWVLKSFQNMIEAKAAKIAADVEKAREMKLAVLNSATQKEPEAVGRPPVGKVSPLVQFAHANHRTRPGARP
jgi:hypothetical protein